MTTPLAQPAGQPAPRGFVPPQPGQPGMPQPGANWRVPPGGAPSTPADPAAYPAGMMPPAHPSYAPPTIVQEPQTGYPASAIPPAPARPGQQVPPQQPGSLPGTGAPATAASGQPPVVPAAPGAGGLDPNMRLTGPNVPNELQGRTVAEVIALYGGMRNAIMQYVSQPQTPPAPGAVAPPQAPAAQPGQAQPEGWDWRNPVPAIQATVRDTVREIIQNEVGPALAPVIQQGNQAAIVGAMQQVAAEVGPAFTTVQARVMQMLQGADPRQLANPQIWRTAANAAIGEAYTQGQLAPRQQGAPMAPAAQPQYPVPQPIPNQWAPPPSQSFFTEQPGAGAGVPPVGLSAKELEVARAMGKTPDEYAAWKGGIQR